jgi:hypothetical protein
LIPLKFLSAVSPWRGRDRRAQDTVDLVRLYRSVGRDGLDLEGVTELASLVYPGAEKELLEILRRVDDGESISIEQRDLISA